MNLIQLIYFSKSTSTHEVKHDVLMSILKKAKSTNSELGISGLLIFSNDLFLQVIEGPRKAVNELYSRIQKDPRHTDIQLLSFRDIARRDFGEWSMGWASETHLKKDIYFKYCSTQRFAAEELTAESSHSLLCEFAAIVKAA